MRGLRLLLAAAALAVAGPAHAGFFGPIPTSVSSMTFTSTGPFVYSITSSSGIHIVAGGVTFPDGSVMFSTAGMGGITALTGDVTATGPGSAEATVVHVSAGAVNLSTVTTALAGKLDTAGIPAQYVNLSTVTTAINLVAASTGTLALNVGVATAALQAQFVTVGLSTTSIAAATTTVNARISAISTANFSSGFNAANQLVQLDGSGKLPVLDGSALTNLPGASIASTSVGGYLNGISSVSAWAGVFGSTFSGINNRSQLSIGTLGPGGSWANANQPLWISTFGYSGGKLNQTRFMLQQIGASQSIFLNRTSLTSGFPAATDGGLFGAAWNAWRFEASSGTVDNPIHTPPGAYLGAIRADGIGSDGVGGSATTAGSAAIAFSVDMTTGLVSATSNWTFPAKVHFGTQANLKAGINPSFIERASINSFGTFFVGKKTYSQYDEQISSAMVVVKASATSSHLLVLMNSAEVELVHVDNLGRVGIATSTPQVPLDVQGVAAFGAGLARSTVGATIAIGGAQSQTAGVSILSVSSGSAKMFAVNNYSHIVTSAAVAPALGTCVNGAIDIPSDDSSGGITFSGVNTSCGLTFAYAAQAGQKVRCGYTAHMATPAAVDIVITGTSITFAAAFVNGDSITYVCHRSGGNP